MAATITNGIATASTTNATTYASGSFTPAAGDFIGVFVHVSGNVQVPTMTDSQNLGFTLIGPGAFDAASANGIFFFASCQAAANSAMTVTFSCVGATASGAVVNPIRVSGMTKFGGFAVRQHTESSNNASSTPTITFGSTPLTTNPCLGVIANSTNAATMTAPTSWTEVADVGYATPTTGLESVGITNGFTSTGVTWGSSSASAWGGIIVELDFSNTGWTIIQSKLANKTVGTGTTSTASLATTVNGSLVVVGSTGDSSTGATTAISCTGMSFTKKVDQTDAFGSDSSLWYSYNTTSAATPTLTMTYVASTIATAYIEEFVYYNAGSVVAITSDPFDKSASTSGLSTTPNSGATATLTGSNDLVVAYAGTLDSGNVYSAGTGYSTILSHKNGTTLDCGIECNVLSGSTSGQTGTFTISASDNWACIVATFQQPSTGGPLSVSVSDTFTTTESVGRTLVSDVKVSDSLTTTENVQATDVDNVAVSDSSTISESVPTPNVSYSPAVSDNSTITENVAVFIPTLTIVKSDTITTTENVSALLTSDIRVSDSSTATESVQALETSFINVSDSLSTTENSSVLVPTLLVAASDTISTAESIGRVLVSQVAVSDSIASAESVGVATVLNAAVSDTLTTTENVAVVLVSNVAVSDSLTTTESVTAFLPILNVNVSTSSTIAESVTVSPAGQGIAVSDTIATTENIAVSVTIAVSRSDTFTTTESLGLTKVSFVNVSDTLTTTENRAAVIPVSIAVSDTITTTESIGFSKPTLSISVSDTITTTEAVSASQALTPGSDSESVIWVPDADVADTVSLGDADEPVTWASPDDASTDIDFGGVDESTTWIPVA